MLHKTHIGIYALITNSINQILLMHKSRGPYRGKLDLPGGRPDYGEEILCTLKREVYEETGVIVHNACLYNNYCTSISFTQEDDTVYLYHIGLIYTITSYNAASLKTQLEHEDSLGADWYYLPSLDYSLLSPFAAKVVTSVAKKPY